MRLSKVDKSLRDLHNSSYHMKADQYYCYNIIGDGLLLNFGRNFSVNF